MPTIEIRVSPTGETEVETSGFSGTACLKASRFIEQALGKAVQDRKTGEYHATDTQARQELRHDAG